MPRGINDFDAAALQGRNSETASVLRTVSPGLITNGLVLYLDAGNYISYPASGTTIVDMSGFGNNATLINGPTYSRDNGGAIVFDGVNDYANIATSNSIDSPLAGDFSYDIWLYPDTPAYSYPKIFSKGYYGSPQNSLQLGANTTTTPKSINVELMVSGVAVYPLSMGYTPLQWYNIVITRSIGDAMNLYSNSSLVASSGIASISASFSNAYPLRLASRSGTPVSEYSLQRVGAFKMYNRALTATEVEQNFNATRARFGL